MPKRDQRSREPWGSITCMYAEALMATEKERELDPFERNALFAHCTICDSCREQQLTFLNEQLRGISITDVI